MNGLLGGNGSDTDATSHRITSLSLLVLASYLAVVSIPLAAWAITEGRWLPIGVHAAILGSVIFALVANLPAVSHLRDWVPLAVGPFLYIELRWIIEGGGRMHADELIRSWEAVVFPTDPSRTLATHWVSGPLSELLHLCYVAYYALVYLPPALLTLTANRPAFVRTTLGLVAVYCLCFSTYVLLPVDGPRFLFGPSSAPDGPIREFVVRLLESGSSRGTAFPSSHVAASVVATLYALRYQRPLGIAMAVVTAGLAIGAVYGGYHYAVDVVAGLATGLLAVGLARYVEGRFTAARA